MGAHGVADVGAVGVAGHQMCAAVREQHLAHSAQHRRRGGGGEGGQHPRLQRLHQLPQAQIGRTEGVAPLADAVRLVHHQVLDGGGRRQSRQQPLGERRLRGGQHQPRAAGTDPLQRLGAFGPALAAAQHHHFQPGAGHAAVQILQQRQQGEHHQGDPLQHYRRKHEAHRLAGPGGQHHDLVASLQQVGDDQPLVGKQVRDSQVARGQRVEGIGGDLAGVMLGRHMSINGLSSLSLSNGFSASRKAVAESEKTGTMDGC